MNSPTFVFLAIFIATIFIELNSHPPPKKAKIQIGLNLPAMSIKLPKLQLPQIKISASIKHRKKAPFVLRLPKISINAQSNAKPDDWWEDEPSEDSWSDDGWSGGEENGGDAGGYGGGGEGEAGGYGGGGGGGYGGGGYGGGGDAGGGYGGGNSGGGYGGGGYGGGGHEGGGSAGGYGGGGYGGGGYGGGGYGGGGGGGYGAASENTEGRYKNRNEEYSHQYNKQVAHSGTRTSVRGQSARNTDSEHSRNRYNENDENVRHYNGYPRYTAASTQAETVLSPIKRNAGQLSSWPTGWWKPIIPSQ